MQNRVNIKLYLLNGSKSFYIQIFASLNAFYKRVKSLSRRKIRCHAEKQFASENSTDFSVLFFNKVCNFYFLSERHIFVFAVNVFVSVVDIFVIGIFVVFKRHIVIARRRDIVVARCGCVVKRHWLVA